MPLVPIVRNVLAKDEDVRVTKKRCVTSRKHRRSKASASLADEESENEGQQRLIFQNLDNTAVVIAGDVMRLDRCYFHLYSGLIFYVSRKRSARDERNSSGLDEGRGFVTIFLSSKIFRDTEPRFYPSSLVP